VLAVGLVLLLAAGGIAILTYSPDDVIAAGVAFLLSGVLAVGLVPGFPRRESDTPPLAPGEHPRLRALVDDVAAAVGARPPQALYVFHAANAFAAKRRPGARRQAAVGLGLPLVAWLTPGELRAVIAHEMGHHQGGDVLLGPWIHRTRRAIVRAADRLEGSSFWLHLPFVAYADFFMKASMRISRAQELAADATAARVAGAAATASALRKISMLTPAWSTYFQCEVLPVVAQGRMPSLLDGFDRYWRAALTPGTPAFTALLSAIAADARPAPEDTHPVLEARLRALGDPVTPAEDETPALDLLDAPARVEERVVRDLLRDQTKALEPVAWDQIAESVWLPVWRRTLEPHARTLASLDPSRLPDALRRWESLAQATRTGPAILSPEAERRSLAGLLGAWLAVRLADLGFRIEAGPGAPVTAERNGRTLAPFKLVEDLLDHPDDDAWAKLCADSGI
jgi:Zn-dependent protease with chaperone function